MRPLDTTFEAHEVQVAAWRRMGGAERLRVALEMSDEARQVTADGIRSRHPEYDAEQVRWALLRLVLGDELFTRAYPRAPRIPP